MEQKYTFHIKGLHCKSCVLVTESELKELPEITDAKTSLANNSVEITGDFGTKTPDEIASDLSKALNKHGYSVATSANTSPKELSDFAYAIPFALLVAVLFIGLQKLNIINIVDTDTVSYGTAFLIGIIASLSTCMAVVGGIVLSMSASYSKAGDKIVPQIYFHLSRLVAFFVLGGIIGLIGTAFTLTSTLSFVLSLGIGIVMLLLGLNLLEVFNITKKLLPAMPATISQKALALTKMNHRLTPLLVGIATFFLPCGFTQSMQLYTLTTNSFTKGGLTMLAFALGTLPVLALISFSSFKIQNKKTSSIFFKTAGLVVIMFSILNILSSLVVIGIIPPILNF